MFLTRISNFVKSDVIYYLINKLIFYIIIYHKNLKFKHVFDRGCVEGLAPQNFEINKYIYIYIIILMFSNFSL